MSWKNILKNDNRNKFPRYIRVDGVDYKISSYSGWGTSVVASYRSVEETERLSDGHLENLTLEYALKHNIDSEYQKEIEDYNRNKLSPEDADMLFGPDDEDWE